MRRYALITLFAVLAGACTAPEDAGSAPDVQALPRQLEATAVTAPPASVEAPEPIVLADIPASPLTDEALAIDDLAVMPLRELSGSFAGFVTTTEGEESNETASEGGAAGDDEAKDIAEFGRRTGYRVTLEPTRLSPSGAHFVDNWVELFTTARGASDYLADYARDLSKGLDSAHDADLNQTDSRSFVVEEMGDEAIGIVLVESSSAGEPYVETIVAMRIGRLLAFVSIGRSTEGDVRVLALELAEQFEQRIVGVLDGSLKPVVATEPPAVLDTYAFEYRQRLEQSFRIVESGVEYAGAGGGEGVEDPEAEEPEPDAPTTTISWTVEDSSTTVTAKGVVTTDAIRCEVSIRNNGRRISRATYVISDDTIWRSTNGRRFKEIDPIDERYAPDLLWCPGWYPSRSESGVRSITRPGRGEIEEAKDGTVTERYDLGLADLVTAGLAGDAGRGLRVNRFKLWTGGEGPWVVGVDLKVTGPTSAMERAFGPAFYPGGSVSIELEFAATRVNDPELVVKLPEA